MGYKDPPKHSQWQKGQSGNPSGKKKQADSFLDKVKKIASEEMVVHKGGHPLAMSYLDAAIYAIFAKAQSGHPAAFKLLMEILGKDAAEAIKATGYTMTEADLSVLKTSADWYALLENAQSKVPPQSPNEHDAGDMDDDDSSQPE